MAKVITRCTCMSSENILTFMMAISNYENIMYKVGTFLKVCSYINEFIVILNANPLAKTPHPGFMLLQIAVFLIIVAGCCQQNVAVKS